uniref:bifunctional demethylmenaquinone methyltransferase/2-methoxy-6-polyprenyl-1,4-benzoquinol methylase UbiE n=1 Tax=Pararhizobium sp. IMCC3301 TaxID=3067904 RepID=UPI002740A100|nr:bifunctional demethylmenaquinone methyltransferase/2-methoxy-6-polyprenyl-1,4-benzoquinol methylase UbiE [Pararhizobium sp. IMCC3301]
MPTNANAPEPTIDPAGMETSFGYKSVARGHKQARVDDVFHKVARRYDLMNDVMSAGLHRLWKDAMISMLAPPRSRPYRVLDAAGGTGDIAFRIANRAGSSAHITVCDINSSMLAVGADRAAKQQLADQVEFVEGNAEQLPFADNCFDAYTIAFGIRNVPRLAQAVQEAHRVLKRGGRFLCLEFSKVDIPVMDRIYEAYSFNAIPLMGELVTNDRDSYQYLVESIRKFPNQARFEQIIADQGFSRVTHRNLTGGVAAIHSGWKL